MFLFLALVGYLIGTYNGLVQVRAGVKLEWSNIDVLLVQRHDELPKLVEVCKQYMQYEPGALERVMRARAGVDTARSSGNVASLGPAERELRSGLTGLYAVAENYPQLKASEPFRHLQERISGLETAITDRREVYNDAVNTNNVRIAAFPGVLVAAMGDFPAAQLLHFQTDEKADVDLRAAFSG
ncbi:MAG: LemA family protein [Steroidobacteraceae bacterium]